MHKYITYYAYKIKNNHKVSVLCVTTVTNMTHSRGVGVLKIKKREKEYRMCHGEMVEYRTSFAYKPNFVGFLCCERKSGDIEREKENE